MCNFTKEEQKRVTKISKEGVKINIPVNEGLKIEMEEQIKKVKISKEFTIELEGWGQIATASIGGYKTENSNKPTTLLEMLETVAKAIGDFTVSGYSANSESGNLKVTMCTA